MAKEVKNHVKPAEQKVIEMAIGQLVAIMQSVYGKGAEVKISISGVPLSKLGHIAECQGWDIDKRYYEPEDKTTNYIRKPFSGEGYSIEEISE